MHSAIFIDVCHVTYTACEETSVYDLYCCQCVKMPRGKVQVPSVVALLACFASVYLVLAFKLRPGPCTCEVLLYY